MAKNFDISVLGDKDLERRLHKLDTKHQGKAVRPALRDSAKRLRVEVLENISKLTHSPSDVLTGTLGAAFAKVKVKAVARDRREVRIGLPLPERTLLGDKAEPPYYPTAVEYGHEGLARAGKGPKVRPYPYIRPAVDNNREREIRHIAEDIGNNILDLAGPPVKVDGAA